MPVETRSSPRNTRRGRPTLSETTFIPTTHIILSRIIIPLRSLHHQSCARVSTSTPGLGERLHACPTDDAALDVLKRYGRTILYDREGDEINALVDSLPAHIVVG